MSLAKCNFIRPLASLVLPCLLSLLCLAPRPQLTALGSSCTELRDAHLLLNHTGVPEIQNQSYSQD